MALKTFMILAIVATMATSFADAQNPLGIVQINGTLYCSANGSPTNNGNTAPVFPNATLQVACTADVIAPGPNNGTTNSNGVYSLYLFPRPNATVNSIVASCRLFVLTPLSNCSLALPTAGLVSNLQFVKTVQVGFLPLRITYMVAAGFSLQA
ncbi:hypothetical protein ACP275_14G243800 [Erythranthe tilingii]